MLCLLLVGSYVAHAARIRPTPASIQAVRYDFASRLDAESDAAVAPLVMDKQGRFGKEKNAAAAPSEKRPTLEELLAPPPKRPRRRGFEWHDPSLRYGPASPTLAERLDAASKVAIELPMRVLDEEGRTTPSPPPTARRVRPTHPTDLGSGPARAAAWLLRKYDEVYGDDEVDERDRVEGVDHEEALGKPDRSDGE